MAMLTSISILTLLHMAAATIWGTCTPKATRTPDLNTMTYPTTLTEVYSCTHNLSMIAPPFFDRTEFSNHEQTLTTLHPFLSKPTLFPYTHAVTVCGVISRTEWIGRGQGLRQTFLSTVTDIETVTMETRKVARAKTTSV
jgi:hypothetical protein